MKAQKILYPQLDQADPASIIALFSSLTDVYFFMKDRKGHFIGANALQLEKMGLIDEADLIGKSDYDFFPRSMVSQYTRDDELVMTTGEAISRRVELVANADGSVSWHVTSKFPLYDKEGSCIGIAGYMRDFVRSENAWQPYRRMNAAVDYISKHYSTPIQIADLAKAASLSISQFERRFQQVFQQTPARFLIRFRLTCASQMLINTEATLSRIAQEVGFYDHSHFSREFKMEFGQSPGQYRQEHGNPQADRVQ
jgi:AraC-like DNA-binding protein